MPLPLPRVVADVGPGGGIISAMNALNELSKQKASIANTNALTQGQNITNQYLPDKLRLANAYQQLQNQYYGPLSQSTIGMQGAKARLDNAQAAIQQQLYNNPGLGGSGVEHAQAVLSLLIKNHPELAQGLSNQAAAGSQQRPASSAPPMIGAAQPNMSAPLPNTQGGQASQQGMNSFAAPSYNTPGPIPGSQGGQAAQGSINSLLNQPNIPVQNNPMNMANIHQQNNAFGFNPAQELLTNINAQNAKEQAMANYYQIGGGRMSVGSKDEYLYQQGIAADNPQLTSPAQVREAEDVYAQGGNQLADGTRLNPLSEGTLRANDRAFKATTTSTAINQGLQANQASAELPVYNKYINDGVKPYGTTVFGTSPQQIKDSTDIGNHTAQIRLGKYIAAQQLLYDRAALMLKINALPPGYRIASKISKLASQSINAMYPTQSAESRQVASDTVAQAIEEGLQARNKYGVGASGAAGRRVGTQSSDNSKVTKVFTRDANGKLVLGS